MSEQSIIMAPEVVTTPAKRKRFKDNAPEEFVCANMYLSKRGSEFGTFKTIEETSAVLMTSIRMFVIDKNGNELNENGCRYIFRESEVFKSNPPFFTERMKGNTTRLSILLDVANEMYAAYADHPEQLTPSIAIQSFKLKLAKAEMLDNSAGAVTKKPRLTIELLEDELGTAGYELRRNCITHEVEMNQYGAVIMKSDFVSILHSDLGQRYTNVTVDTLNGYLSVIANRHEYNPVLDFFKSFEHDGNDRFPQLFSLMGIDEPTPENILSQILVHKWMLQGIALLHNSNQHSIGAEGILVLLGTQGSAKTSLLKLMAIRPEWFLEGATINQYDKDTSRRAITCWITELGEIESTFKKSDVTDMKNLITRSKDHFRLPYAHFDEDHPRRTNLAATCNSSDYLVDDTGNRRYFTVEIPQKMSYAELSKFDFAQLWRQVLDEYERIPTQYGKDKCFRLDSDEFDDLNNRNAGFAKKLKAETEILDIFAEAEERPEKYENRVMTVSKWKEGWSRLQKYDSREIGKVLRKMGIEGTHGKHGSVYELPVARRE